MLNLMCDWMQCDDSSPQAFVISALATSETVSLLYLIWRSLEPWRLEEGKNSQAWRPWLYGRDPKSSKIQQLGCCIGMFSRGILEEDFLTPLVRRAASMLPSSDRWQDWLSEHSAATKSEELQVKWAYCWCRGASSMMDIATKQQLGRKCHGRNGRGKTFEVANSSMPSCRIIETLDHCNQRLGDHTLLGRKQCSHQQWRTKIWKQFDDRIDSFFNK